MLGSLSPFVYSRSGSPGGFASDVWRPSGLEVVYFLVHDGGVYNSRNMVSYTHGDENGLNSFYADLT